MLFCAYDTLYYWHDNEHVVLWQYMLATLIPAALTWLVFLLRCGKPGKRAAAAAVAALASRFVLLAVALGSAEWLVTTRLAPILGWPEYVTIVPPLIGVCFFAALAVFAGLSSLVLEDQGSRMAVARLRRHSADVRRLGWARA